MENCECIHVLQITLLLCICRQYCISVLNNIMMELLLVTVHVVIVPIFVSGGNIV